MRLARPGRLAVQLAMLPLGVMLAVTGTLAPARRGAAVAVAARRSGEKARRRHGAFSPRGRRCSRRCGWPSARSPPGSRSARACFSAASRIAAAFCATPLRRCACCGRGTPRCGSPGLWLSGIGIRMKPDVDRFEAAVVRELGRAGGHADDQVHLCAQRRCDRPARERGGRIRSSPDGSTSTFMNTFNVVGIASGAMPNGARLRTRFSKQLGWWPVVL